ncbi:hypothetical protein [Dyella silvatica]
MAGVAALTSLPLSSST